MVNGSSRGGSSCSTVLRRARSYSSLFEIGHWNQPYPTEIAFPVEELVDQLGTSAWIATPVVGSWSMLAARSVSSRRFVWGGARDLRRKDRRRRRGDRP
jgi:hypothetical protein